MVISPVYIAGQSHGHSVIAEEIFVAPFNARQFCFCFFSNFRISFLSMRPLVNTITSLQGWSATVFLVACM